MLNLSVIIPHYGGADDTLRLVNSLQRQSTQYKVEIIVSDDNSPVPFPAVEGATVVRRQHNGGFGANVNSGVKAASGNWLLILNSDLTLPSSFIDDMYKAAEEEQVLAGGGGVVIAPHIVGHEGESQWVGRAFPRVRHHAWEWFTPAARLRRTRFWHRMVGHDLACIAGNRAEPDWLMGACLMMPRSVYNEVGGMDESFFMNSEEVDIQYRLMLQGVPRVFRGDITVAHEGGGSSGDTARRRQWVTNSRFLYEKKWGHPQKLRVALTAVTHVNYLFNRVRRVRNSAVKPREIRQTELSTIQTAFQQVS